MQDSLAATLNPAGQAEAEGIAADRFDEIVRQHQRRVYRVVLLLVKNADVADTLTQECFLRAYQKRSGFRGECAIATWLLRIAVNLVRDHEKSQRVSFWRKLIGLDEVGTAQKLEPNLISPHASPERALLAREELAAVWAALTALSPKQRTVFLLRHAEEMSLPEIAEILQLQVGSVKAQLFRATSKVKEVVKGKPCSSSAI